MADRDIHAKYFTKRLLILAARDVSYLPTQLEKIAALLQETDMLKRDRIETVLQYLLSWLRKYDDNLTSHYHDSRAPFYLLCSLALFYPQEFERQAYILLDSDLSDVANTLLRGALPVSDIIRCDIIAYNGLREKLDAQPALIPLVRWELSPDSPENLKLLINYLSGINAEKLRRFLFEARVKMKI